MGLYLSHGTTLCLVARDNSTGPEHMDLWNMSLNQKSGRILLCSLCLLKSDSPNLLVT